MMAATGLNYQAAYDMLVSWCGSNKDAGRQMAHAMAHGFYGNRAYVVTYNEKSGTFGLMHN